MQQKDNQKSSLTLDQLLGQNMVETHNGSRKALLKALGKSKNGTIIRNVDDSGKVTYYFSTGKSKTAGKKQVHIISGNIKTDNSGVMKMAIGRLLLKKTIEKSLKPFLKKQETKEQKRSLADLTYTSQNTDNSASGSFEAKFKEMVKEHGHAAWPSEIAKALVRPMSQGDQNNLSHTLQSMGVRTNEDFVRLLSKWTTEALDVKQQAIKSPQVQHRFFRQHGPAQRK
jgi:hypothetical protein